MDVHTKNQRSYNMSQVKSENTKPEKLMFSLLKKSGYKFERHYSIHGKPDIAFPENKLTVFIDGEFWHGRNFSDWSGKLSKFWYKKISENIKRDGRNRRLLRKEGWHVMRFWDKKILKDPQESLNRIINFIRRIQADSGNHC